MMLGITDSTVSELGMLAGKVVVIDWKRLCVISIVLITVVGDQFSLT